MSAQHQDLLSIEVRDGIHVVRCLTETLLDPVDIERVDIQIQAAMASVSTPRVVVNLQSVNHMASLMLSVLIKLHQDVQAKGGAVALASIPKRLQDLFELVGLDHIFDSYETPEEALAALQN